MIGTLLESTVMTPARRMIIVLALLKTLLESHRCGDAGCFGLAGAAPLELLLDHFARHWRSLPRAEQIFLAMAGQQRKKKMKPIPKFRFRLLAIPAALALCIGAVFAVPTTPSETPSLTPSVVTPTAAPSAAR